MFSLIITIISIALVIALAAATMYYISGSTKNHVNSAEASRLINESTQVKASVTLYETENGAAPVEFTDLKDKGYLRAGLDEYSWRVRDGLAITPVESEDVCNLVNERLGVTEIPSCDDDNISKKVVCCTLPEDTGSEDDETP